MEDLTNLFEQFVSDTEELSKQIVELAIPSGAMPTPSGFEDTLKGIETFVASVFSSSRVRYDQALALAEKINTTILEISTKIKMSTVIPVSLYKRWIRDLNDSTDFVRLANAKSLPENTTSEVEQERYKRLSELIFHVYRSGVLHFNACIVLYNECKIGQKLSPLASTDVSPK